MTDAEKKPMEFWIDETLGYVYKNGIDATTSEIHCIEFSAFQEAQEKIKHLEARVEEIEQNLVKANGMLRSCFMVANRMGKDTNWWSFNGRLKELLDEQAEYLAKRSALKEDGGMG